jgi:hypothetical protein
MRFCGNCGTQLNWPTQQHVQPPPQYQKQTQQWLQMFIPLYRQADPLIQIIAKLDVDGLPADLQTLTEANWKLQPILQDAKRLPAPKQKEFRSIKKDFENVLSLCIKASEIGAKMLDDMSHGAPKIALRMRLATIVGYTVQAGGHYESLCKRLSSAMPKVDSL